MPRTKRPRERAVAARILVVDDAPDTVELIQRNLASQDYSVFTASNAADALSLLDSVAIDLVVTDIRMPGLSGIELIREARGRRPEIEIIVITGYATIEGAVEALQVGAWDYLAKPFTDEELFQAVRRVLARHSGKKPEPSAPALIDFHGLLGRAKAMRSLFDALAAAAKGAGAVLLRGEPGSGREAAARALHTLAETGGPFLRVSLDARVHFPAAGGAAEFLAGLAQSSAGGTLYLSSLDGASGDVLRGTASLLGSGKKGARRRSPARIVASVAAGADELARRGPAMTGVLRRFDWEIAIPPLRERGEDVVFLARRFLAESAAASGLAVRPLTEAAVQAVRSYSWPGNVRELRDLAGQLALSGRSGPVDAGELPAAITGALGRESAGDVSLAAVEQEHIARVLRRTSGNKSRAAEILGIDRKTLRDKLRSSGGRSRVR